MLRTGLTLIDVLSTLIESLPEDAFPGEEPAQVLVEMLVGTFRPAGEAAGHDALLQATALVGALGDRAFADLQRAACKKGD